MSELPPMSELDNLSSGPEVAPQPEIAPPSPTQAIKVGKSLAPKLKKVLLIALGLLSGLIVVGLIYRSISSQPAAPAPVASSDPTPTPVASTGTKDLRVGSLSIPYLDNWLVLFSPIVDSKTPDITPLYFVRSQQEYREQAQCASTGSCTSAPIALTFSPDTAIWTGYSLVDYMRTADPSYPIDKLAVTNLAGHDAYVGYTDLAKLEYQVLVKTSDTTFQSLVLTAREDTRDMLAQLVMELNSLSILSARASSPSELTTPITYTLKLSARLATTEYDILELILTNLLPPQDATASPNYFLYTEGNNSYPPGNYLDFTYYLLTDNPDLVTGKYELAQLSATLSTPPSDNFASYLDNPKYCQENTDCVYRANSCTYDAYNRYSYFTGPQDCKALDYAGLGTSEELIESLRCQDAVEITYDSLECIANQCLAHNPTPVCSE